MSLTKYRSYEYHDVYVTADSQAEPRTAFVVFSAWSPTGEGTVFGGDFFLGNGIPAYFIVQRANVWYRSPDIIDIARDIVAHAADAKYSLVLYGASMGGYAAVNLRNQFNAACSIAIAPQVLVLPENSSFESRWVEERKALPLHTFEEKENLATQVGPLIVFFDPHHLLDNKHIECLKLLSNAHASANELIEVPYGSHDIARALVKNRVIQQHLIEISKGRRIGIEMVVEQCANLFRHDCKAFLNYYRTKVAATDVEALNDDYRRFVSFVSDSGGFDFESCYMAAEIYAKLNNKAAAVKFSMASLERYSRDVPDLGIVPNYLHLKHASILKKFGMQHDVPVIATAR